MKRIMVLAGLVGLGALSLLLAQPARQQNVAEIEKVKDNLYLIKGGGGNTAAFIMQSGVAVVDTKLEGWGPAILDKIKSVTNKPVTTIINTHTHGDHVGSNSEFPASVEIVAHENCKASMERMTAFQREYKKFLPHKTYKDKMTLFGGKERIDLYYFGRGHTSGDTIIVFPELRVAHTGDLFAAKGTPGIDVSNGGSALEYPKTLTKAAAGIRGVDVVIPGHSSVTDWKAFQEFGEFNSEFLAAAQAALKAGKTAGEAAAALKLPEKFKEYNMGSAKGNIEIIYAEMKK
jgi:glyoxylase-like metal-dependent hydrolase (beta-lactamase superfamily II)